MKGHLRKAFLRYSLIQVSELLVILILMVWLSGLIGFPAWVVAVVIAAFAIKDIALFPHVWRAYDSSYNADRFSMVGLVGRSEEEINPGGHVRVRGERWQARVAEDEPPIDADCPVRVVGIEGLTLVVEKTSMN